MHFIALEVEVTIMRYYLLRFLCLHVSLDVATVYVRSVYHKLHQYSNIDNPNVVIVVDDVYNTLLMIIIINNKSKEVLD